MTYPRDNMRPLTLEVQKEGTIAHWLYDLGITDIEERKQKRQYFDSGTDLAAHLGVILQVVCKNRNVGSRIYSPKFKREFAVRLAH